MANKIRALQDELTNDPAGLGLQPLVSTGQTGAIADLLNQVRDDVLVDRGEVAASDLAYEMFIEGVEMRLAGSPAALLAVGAPDTIANSLTATDGAIFTAMLDCFSAMGSVNVNRPQFLTYLNLLQQRGVLRDRVQPDGATLAVAEQIKRLTKRPGSRAEALLGDAAFVTNEDVARAIRRINRQEA